MTTGSTEDTCYAPKVWSGGSCACPSDKPTWDSTNNQCVACTTAKPYWDSATQTCKTCYEVNNAEPKWNTSTSACEACPTANPYWDGTQCVATCPANTYLGNNNVCVNVTTWCTQKMQNVGYSTSNFTVSGITITYKSDMTISTALDISKCDLTVQGKLTVNSGKSLKALVVSATSSSSQGVNNVGTITATTLTGKSTTSQYGIYNSGTITVSNGTITGESAKSHGIYNNGTSAQITAKTIDGKNSTTSDYKYYGLYVNSGTVKATSGITGTGGSGVYNNGKVTATMVTGTGGTSGWGILNYGTIEATTVTGNDPSVYGIDNAGTIKATTVTGTGSWGVYNVSTGTVTSKTVNATGTNGPGLSNQGTMTVTGDVTGQGTSGYLGVYNYARGILTATNIYYCKTIKNEDTATISGTQKCKSGCTCTN